MGRVPEGDHVFGNRFYFFSHYTPFLPILFTLSSLIFGLHEHSLRLVTLLFSLLMLVYIYRIGELLYSHRVGITAALITLATPMFLYFGTLPDHEPIVTALITTAFYYYLRLTDNHPPQKIFFLFLGLALLESWSAFFLLAVLVIHSFQQLQRRKWLWPMLFLGAAVIVFQLSFTMVFNGSEGISSLLEQGRRRTSLVYAREFFSVEARYLAVYFTRILLALSVIWWLIVSKKKLLSLLFFAGVGFLLVFSELAFKHDYKLYLLLPFLALSGASALNQLLSRWPRFSLVIIPAVVLMIFVERLSFVKTQFASSYNQPGYVLGLLLKAKTQPPDKVLLLSKEFDNFYDVYFRYYANRTVASKDVTFSEWQMDPSIFTSYRYAVLVKNRPIDRKLEDYLLKNYSSQTEHDFTLIDLRSTGTL